MPRVQVGYDPRAEALQTVASPNIQTEQARFDPNASKAYQLAAALGKAQPVIDKFMSEYEQRKQQEEILKIPAFIAKAQRELGDGTVKAAQNNEIAPSSSSVVNARVNDGLGAEWGRKNVQPLIDGIMQNADLQTNSEARAAAIKEGRAKLLDQLPKNNDFFVSGAITAIDREIGQRENQWQNQTAQYHKEVQVRDFSGKVVDALKTGDPAKALEALDATWKNSSSLNNLERNKVVVDTVTQQAFASDDPSMLDRIPTRFRNAETDAQIKKTKILIQEKRMQTVRDAKFLTDVEREEITRKDTMEMINAAADGQPIDPSKYRDRPDSYQKALTIKDADRMPAAQSAANYQKVRTGILNGATTVGLDQNKVVDDILSNKNINNADKRKLIEEVPRLIEGTIAMNDDMVKSVYSTRVGASLDALEKSPNARISNIVTGTNLRGNAVKMFDQGIRMGFNAYYEENGKWPTGKAKQDIVDAQVDRAEAFIANQVKLGGNQAAAPGETAAPAAKPTTAKPTPTQADIDFVKKNPQYKQQFINQFGREP
jgi:hypothetical protein